MAACAPNLTTATAISTSEATKTPFQPPKAEASTATPTEYVVKTLEQRFNIAGWQTDITPFEITTSNELMHGLGHVVDTPITVNGYPIPVKGPVIDDSIAVTADSTESPFGHAGLDHSHGNPVITILTNGNAVLLDSHSIQTDSPGDLPRKIGAFVYKNPEKAKDIYGTHLTIKTKDGLTLDATLEFAITIDGAHFSDQETMDSPWGVYPPGSPGVIPGVAFAVLERMGIPAEIVNDTNSDVSYVVISGCQNRIPGDITAPHPALPALHIPAVSDSEAYAENTFYESLIVLKIIKAH